MKAPQWEFSLNGKQVRAAFAQPFIKSRLFSVFECNHPEYFIKVYTLNDPAKAKSFSSNFLRVSKELDPNSEFSVRILDQKFAGSVCVMLMDAYSKDLRGLLEIGHFSVYGDLGKLVDQLARIVEVCGERGVSGFSMGERGVVLDCNGNYKLTHFDEDLKEGGSLESEIKDGSAGGAGSFPRAPEWFEGNGYTTSSLMWELGIYVYEVLYGSLPKVDYKAKSISFPATEDDTLFGRLARKLLSFEAENRPTALVVRGLVAGEIASFREHRVGGEAESGVFELGPGNDPIVSGKGEAEGSIPLGLRKTEDCVKYLLDPKLGLAEEPLARLVTKAWKDGGEKIAKFYAEVGRVLDSRLADASTSTIVALKTLILLHGYVHRGPKTCLIIFEQNSPEVNMLSRLIERAESALSTPGSASSSNQLTKPYARLVSSKVALLRQNLRLTGNNFSLSRARFRRQWPTMLDPVFFVGLAEHLNRCFAFLMNAKRYSFNSLGSNILVFAAREFGCSLSMFFNTVLFQCYAVAKLSGKQNIGQVVNWLRFAAFICENHRVAFNAFAASSAKMGFSQLRKFEVPQNLLSYILQTDEQFSADFLGFDTEMFSRNFLGVEMKLPPCAEEEDTGSRPPADDSTLGFQKACEEFQLDDLYFLKVLPNYKPIPSMILPNSDSPSVIYVPGDLEDYTTPNGRANPSDLPKIDAAVQATPPASAARLIKDRRNKKANKHHQRRIRSASPPPKSDEASPSNPEATPDPDDFSVPGTVETFLMGQFARSVDEWLINFTDLEFNNLIATGSTCQVYRGTYRNIPVAIKKLLRPESDQKIKFFKEFKRELALLVSLPAHSNLLTLIGFCVDDHEFYLVTEFCEGGTLFDILYRKTLGFDPSLFAHQQATPEDSHRRLQRDAIPSRAATTRDPPRLEESKVL